jgi:hypothetical protein
MKLGKLLDRRWLWPVLVLAVAFALRAFYGPIPGGPGAAAGSESCRFEVFVGEELLGE